MSVCPIALSQKLDQDLRYNVGSAFAGLIPRLTEPPPDATLKQIAAFSIRKSFLKKLEVENTDALDDRAMLKFLACNIACKEWVVRFTDSWDEVLLGELKQRLYDFYHDSDKLPLFSSLSQILSHGRVGPGAAVGAVGGDFYSKMFSSQLTVTSPGLYRAYSNYISAYPTWNDGENLRNSLLGLPHVVSGSRFSFVPKNDQISRTICIEPSLNMFYQLGLGRLIELRMKEVYGIDIQNQQFKNRELARRGSLGEGYVTCDLSNASDSMSVKMLKEVLPGHIFDMLMLLRSRTTDVECYGVQVDLEMISTMGNGFTFPLMTQLLTAIVLTAYKVNGIKPIYPRGRGQGNFGVFGDDIICVDKAWRDVSRLLKLLGFVVNKDKTFVEGPFRESCGEDFFNGVNVRGVYVKRLHTQQDLVSVVNQLNLFSTRTGISLRRTVQYLMKYVRWLPVPRWDNDDAGIKVPLAIGLEKELRVSRHYQSLLYYRYEPVGKKIRIAEDAIFVPPRSKPRIYNPQGLLTSFLQGSINGGMIPVRHDRVIYRRKLGVAPNWDTTPTTHPIAGWFPWQRWDTAVYLNLFG